MATPAQRIGHSRAAGAVRLVLGSASPSRLRLLRDAGFDPEVLVSGVDESAYRATSPDGLASALAVAKARAVVSRVGGDRALVVGCDSVLAIGGETLGKPAGPEEAARRLRARRGRTGRLVTGHCVTDTATGREETAVVETVVRFGSPTDAEVDAYVATGEPMQAAGGFTIEGYGGPFVDGLDGDWSNVLGLSLPVFRRLLHAHGFAVTDLWTRTPSHDHEDSSVP